MTNNPTRSPAVQSLRQEKAEQRRSGDKSDLEEGLEETFPASDPVSASSTTTATPSSEASASRSMDGNGAPGTTDQSPRWEGPESTRPRGYLPAKDDPDMTRDAAGETNRDPDRRKATDALKIKGD